jgi:UDP-glucuronate 4-epimerase
MRSRFTPRQAGVRYSLQNPQACADSNLTGFINILEGCSHSKIEHLVFASSSSVYGNKTKVPFAVSQKVDRPISLYAATKKAKELMAHSYSHLYNLSYYVPSINHHIPVGAGFGDGRLLASIVGEPAPTRIAIPRPDMISITGWRFFTVYGSWGQPDLADFKLVNLSVSFPTNLCLFLGKTIRQALNLS